MIHLSTIGGWVWIWVVVSLALYGIYKTAEALIAMVTG